MIGALWVFAAALSFTAMMTLVKFLSGDYAVMVQSAYRQLASLLLFTPLLATRPRRTLASSRIPQLLVTIALSTFGLVLSFHSYETLAFSEANALSFTKMLWLVPLAMLFLNERVGAIQIAATLAGFGGVVVMLWPISFDHLVLGHASALGAALTAALVIASMKSLMRDHSPLTFMAWSAVAGLMMSLPPAMLFWRWPSTGDLLLLLVMGGLGVATQGLYVKGLSHGDAAAVSMVDYSRLILAGLVGWFVFDERPSLSTALGAAITVLATMITGWNDFRKTRARAAAADAG